MGTLQELRPSRPWCYRYSIRLRCLRNAESVSRSALNLVARKITQRPRRSKVQLSTATVSGFCTLIPMKVSFRCQRSPCWVLLTREEKTYIRIDFFAAAVIERVRYPLLHGHSPIGGWDLNRGSLALEATALPTEPRTPMPSCN